jgi:hypothetical protein
MLIDRVLCVYILMMLCMTSISIAQTGSANYRIEPMVFASGGEFSQTNGYALFSSVGQSAMGIQSTNAFTNEVGFPSSDNFAQFDFDLGVQGWTFGSTIPFTSPGSAAPSGRLDILPSNNTSNFGFWYSPESIDVMPDKLYRVSFFLTTDITNQAQVPGIRLRIMPTSFPEVISLNISSGGNGESSPTSDLTRHDVFYYPNQDVAADPATELSLAMDMLNFDPGDATSGRISLEYIALDLFPLSALTNVSTVIDYTFETDTEGWSFSPEIAPFISPTFDSSGGALSITSTSNTLNFGYWVNDPEGINTAANTLYRATFTARTDQASPTAVPSMRGRLGGENHQLSAVLDVNTAAAGSAGLGAIAKDFVVYVIPPQDAVLSTLNGLVAAFDLLSFDPNHVVGSTLFLDECLIEAMDIPTIP